MEDVYVTDKVFEKEDFTGSLPKGEYEGCRFVNCNFANSDLSGRYFADCAFEGCDLSMAVLKKTTFRDVVFRQCKMLGLQLGQCNEFGLSFSFEDCILNHASFYQVRAKDTIFRNTQMQEVDFSDCELNGAVFDNCDLLNANFDNANIEGADLRTATNYIVDPERNRIRKAQFSVYGISGLLAQYDIRIDGL